VQIAKVIEILCHHKNGQNALRYEDDGVGKIGRDRMKRLTTIFVRSFSALIMITSAQYLAAQDLTTDPQGAGVVVNAMRWMQGTLLGTVATVAAVIAIASVGFLMLTGRVNWRHGGVVILGCFILFGAASIVAGIQSAATLSGGG
jgi:type IV secretion system protein VirB2